MRAAKLFLILVIYSGLTNLNAQTLVGYWPFTGNTADSSGMGNHGTIVSGSGSVTLTTDRFNNPNSAYLFNNGRINIGSSGFPTGNGQRTMCAWFKRNAVNTSTAHYILSIGGNSFDGCRSSIVIDNINTWIGVENRWPANYKVWQPDTNWHFLCAVFPQGSTVCGDYKVYFDGVYGIDTFRFPNTPLNTNIEAPAIGCLGSADVYFFHGKIDDVRLYSTALNATQILELYNSPPAMPTLLSPANNSSGISVTPLLDWNTVPFTSSYRVLLSSDSTFATTQLDSTINVDSLRIPPGRLANNVKYYWKVRSINLGGRSPYTAHFNFTTSLVGINQTGNEIPESFKLYNNYPNPFNPTTKIRFDISGTSVAQTFLSVYDMLGREVATLVNEELKPGTYEVEWSAEGGETNFASGVYFYKIVADGFTDTKRMVLIK